MLLYVHRDHKDSGRVSQRTVTSTDFHTTPDFRLLYIIVQVQCCFTSTETIRTIRDGDRHLDFDTAPEFRLLDIIVQVQCCFTSTETIKTTRDGHLDFHTAPEL